MVAFAETNHVGIGVNLPDIDISATLGDSADHIPKIVVYRIVWVMVGMVVMSGSRRWGRGRTAECDVAYVSGRISRTVFVVPFVVAVAVSLVLLAVGTFSVEFLFLATFVVATTSVVVGKSISGPGKKEEGEE